MTRRKVGGILAAALVIVIGLGLVAGAVAQGPDGTVTDLSPNEQWGEVDATETLHRAPLNPECIEYLENPPEPFYGYIPPPMDLSHIGKTNALTAQSVSHPADPSFDWRNTGKVTPVKNQLPCGTCWIFGTLSALESRVLIGDDVQYDPSMHDFSEQNIACCTDPSWVYLINNRCDGGGSSLIAMDVLTKRGTRLESCDPYNTGTINTEPCDDSCSTIKRVTGSRWITDDPNDIAEVKDAIYNYGPVTMAYYHDDSHLYQGSIYYWPYCMVDPNHLVSIVGWDDSITHPFRGGSGAWIVKNSWGTSWGDSGYFYLCYGSANMQEVASYRYQDFNPNETLYYWDEAGIVAATGWTDTSAWMASVFTSQQSGDLTHVELWATADNAQYEIYVYDGSFGSQLAYQAGTCDEFGYYSIPLSSSVSLTNGQQFTVAAKMTTPGFNFPIPVEYQLAGVVEPPIQTGVTFERHLDSAPWTDAGLTWNENVCLRARVSIGIPPSPTPTPTPTPIPPPTRTWIFTFGAQCYPRDLPDAYTGEVKLDELTDIPDCVQGVYFEDGTSWSPGAPGNTLYSLYGGDYNYTVCVNGNCEWEIPLP